MGLNAEVPMLTFRILTALVVALVATGCISNEGDKKKSKPTAALVDPAQDDYTHLVPANGQGFISHVNDRSRLITLIGSKEYYFSLKQTGNITAQAAKARRTLKSQPFQLGALKALAYEALADNNPEGAQAFLKIATDKKVGLDDEAYVILGVAHLIREEERKGFEMLERAEAMNSRNILPAVNMGLFHLAKGSGRDAAIYFRRVLLVEPNNPVAHIHAGDAFYLVKDFKNSIAHFDKVLELSPDNQVARYNLGIVYHVGLRQYGKAKNHFQKLLEDKNLDPTIRSVTEGALKNVAREEHGREGLSTIGVF